MTVKYVTPSSEPSSTSVGDPVNVPPICTFLIGYRLNCSAVPTSPLVAKPVHVVWTIPRSVATVMPDTVATTHLRRSGLRRHEGLAAPDGQVGGDGRHCDRPALHFQLRD